MLATLLILAGTVVAGYSLSRAVANEGPAEQAAVKSAEAPAVAGKPCGDMTGDAGTTVEDLAARARRSVVVITYTGRDGERQGLGSGFIVSPDGLIATNLHVIGEGRPVSVELADGTKHEVTSVHATEDAVDLALLRIDAGEPLPALELGDSETLQQGEQVVAIGNPHGLEHSVVSGVVSGKRTVDDKPMIQLAIPIERGNSGGPLLDMQGRVHGILTLKSLVTENLGFAVEINALKPLLNDPNPISMSRWVTIGALDPDEWTRLGGARWRQRAGHIVVEGRGDGFGGRSLCLSTQETPDKPFEVAVSVKFEPESGAAGLVFHADGEDKHYGFYPSSGQLRLSRFDGPTVFSWRVLEQFRSPHYRPGEWNRLKLRIAPNKVRGYLNGHEVVEARISQYVEGRVGLAKFRETKAEFKNFQIAQDIPSRRPSPETVKRVADLVTDIALDSPPRPDLVEELLPESETGRVALRERARSLEKEAERLRQLARSVHREEVQRKLTELLDRDEAQTDLLHAALLVARLDNEDLNVESYLDDVQEMVAELSERIDEDAAGEEKLAALNEYLFNELGFHGSRTNYYNTSNSYLNEVIDDREGLPITLSVLYMEMARRLGLKVVGVGLPGHFVVRYQPEEGESRLIDVFDDGRTLTREQAAAKVEATAGEELHDEHLRAVRNREVIVRMLHNLMNVAREQEDEAAMHRYADTLVAVEPENPAHRMFRAVLRFRTRRLEGALADTDWILENRPAGIDLRRVRGLRRRLEEARQTPE